MTGNKPDRIIRPKETQIGLHPLIDSKLCTDKENSFVESVPRLESETECFGYSIVERIMSSVGLGYGVRLILSLEGEETTNPDGLQSTPG